MAVSPPASLIVLSLCVLAACAVAPGRSSDPASARLREQTEQPVAELRGLLVHRPLPITKSVRAYQGHEFYLVPANKEGREEVLQPSAKVSRADLLRLVNKRVIVTGVYVPGRRPHPRSSFPTGPDGEPLLQGGGLSVLSIRLLGD